MGDHQTPEKVKTESVFLKSSKFSNFCFKIFGRLDHILSFAFFEKPVYSVINSLLKLINSLLKLISSRFLLLVTKRKIAKAGPFSFLSVTKIRR